MNLLLHDILTRYNLDSSIRTFPQSTHTAQQAANALGCTVGQIGKSIVLKTVRTHKPVVVIASGPNRVDFNKVARLVGESIEKADAAFVKNHTGVAIGGVPPFGYPQPLRTFLDADLMSFETVWCAAGSDNSVFLIQTRLLQTTTQALIADIKE